MKKPSVPAAVKTAYTNNRLALLIGSGLSMGADVKGGFPKWGEVGERLLDYAVENDLIKPAKAKRRRADVKEAETLAELLGHLENVKTVLGGHYSEALSGIFWPDGAVAGAAHKAIHALEVKALLTTNYDRLLEESDTTSRPCYPWSEATKALNALKLGKSVLFKVHGTVDKAETVVLTQREYDEIERNGSYKMVLRHLLMSHAFLFVGYGMEDPFDLDRILLANQVDFKDANQEHFALMKGVSPKEADRYLKEFKVRVMPIDDHGQIVPFLNAIRSGRTRGGPARKGGALVPTRKMVVAAPAPIERELEVYREKVEALHASLHLAGFSTQLRVPLDLEALCIPLRATVDVRVTGGVDFPNEEEAEKCLRGRDSLDIALPDAFAECEKRKRRGIVILGDPGAGKTTHLKCVLLACCREGPRSIGLPEQIVPVFLPLRELKDLKSGLDDFIQTQIDENVHLGMAPDFGRRLLNRGHLLFLLDGFDEVSELGDRKRLAKWINEARKVHASCRFVVTSRFAGYRGVSLDADFLTLHIRHLSDDQAERFVHKWYQIVETAQQPDPVLARTKAKEGAEALVARLRGADFQAARVYELAHNPLLLTNLCLVHRDKGGHLPRKRARLYKECIEVLLAGWREAKGLRFIDVDTGRRVLQPAALFMHEEENRKQASAAVLSPVIAPALMEVKWTGGGAEDFLSRVRDESGLLTGLGDGTFKFMHLGFQEYLAARAIRDRFYKGDTKCLALLAERFGNSWWQEVTLLLLALEDPSVFTPLMQEVVKRQAFAENRFMDECLSDAAEVSPQPFLELVEIPPGKDKALWARQLAALRILAQMGAGELEALEKKLSTHPSQDIQSWLRERRGEEARTSIRSEPGGYELLFIPGGEFLMGSPSNEKGRSGDEGPRHRVRVADFHLGRYPVTNEEYARFLEANPKAAKPEYWGDRQYNQPRQPVVGVDWDDARAYCEWAGLRLPSEAEWEYACRAGTTTRYWSGDGEADLARVGWYWDNSDKRLHSVGEKEANPYGLYDMHGNVWEWVEDDWHDDYKGAPVDGSAWAGKGRAELRVSRGGAWDYVAGSCRSASRGYWGPGARDRTLGFRPARSIP